MTDISQGRSRIVVPTATGSLSRWPTSGDTSGSTLASGPTSASFVPAISLTPTSWRLTCWSTRQSKVSTRAGFALMACSLWHISTREPAIASHWLTIFASLSLLSLCSRRPFIQQPEGGAPVPPLDGRRVPPAAVPLGPGPAQHGGHSQPARPGDHQPRQPQSGLQGDDRVGWLPRAGRELVRQQLRETEVQETEAAEDDIRGAGQGGEHRDRGGGGELQGQITQGQTSVGLLFVQGRWTANAAGWPLKMECFSSCF